MRPEQTDRHGRRRLAPLWLAVGTGAGCLVPAFAARAADAIGAVTPMQQFPAAQVFTLLFLMLGPFKILGPFAKITKGMDDRATRHVALWGTLFASLALLVAAFLGESILRSYGIPLPILALSAGIILFLVALLNILHQFMPSASAHAGGDDAAPKSPIRIALTQLAFPTIVTPYGVAALVVLLSLSPDLHGQLTVGPIVLTIMLLNLDFMLTERYILPALAVALPILGAVLGVVQVALGLQIIVNSLRALGLL